MWAELKKCVIAVFCNVTEKGELHHLLGCLVFSIYPANEKFKNHPGLCHRKYSTVLRSTIVVCVEFIEKCRGN